MITLTDESSDDHLVSSALKGDDGAFAQLVTRYKRRVFRLAARFAHDNDELEDLCQEAFIKAYENLSSFRRDAPFEHWLMRITVHVCQDALRSRRRNGNHSTFDGQQFEVRDLSADARHEAQQARDLLAWALARLKPDERLVITLLELEEYSVREIAVMTGWSEANVKVRAHRARQALKKILEQHDER